MSKKHLVFINSHYHPDVAATSLALTDLAEYLTKHDYKVSIITSRNPYAGSSRFSRFEHHNGVDIYRLGNSNFGRESNKGRLIDYATFFILALRRLLFLRFDVLITLTTPPLIGLLHTLMRPFKSAKHINWFMDLHPDAEVAHKMIKQNSSVYKVLYNLQDIMTNSLDFSVVLSSKMKQRLVESVRINHPVQIIKIWTNEDEVQPLDKYECRKGLPEWLKERFIINYSGNMGNAHDFESIFSLLAYFKNDDRIGFIFTGGGPQLAGLKAFIAGKEIDNVLIRPYDDRSELSKSFARADLHLVTLKIEFEGIAFPSKTYGYMASGRPILFIGDITGDTAIDIRNAEGGFVFTPDRQEVIVSAIENMLTGAIRLEVMGEKAYNYFNKYASRNAACEKWNQLMDQCLN